MYIGVQIFTGNIMIFGKKRKLHDGYIIKDGYISFYNDSLLNKELHSKTYRVDQDKVTYYEGMCETYRNNFMEIGWLRLHTPLEQYQEHLGTHFLSVPSKHRKRIADMLEGGTLITLDNLQTFRVVETGKYITLQELLGGEELIDFLEEGKQNSDKFNSGAITKEEFERQIEVIRNREKEKFHIECFTVQGMLIE